MILALGLAAGTTAAAKEGARGPETVRVDARDYPFSAIGRLNLGGSGYCSAVLVGPDLVLSAANCLYNRTEGRWWGKRELFFQGGYQFENAGSQSAIAAYAAPKNYRPGGRLTLNSARVDFALLKLKTPIGKRAGWLGLRWNDGAMGGRGATLHHAGYARDRQHVQVVDAGCIVVAGACALTRRQLALRPIAEQGGGFFALPLRAKASGRQRAHLKRITAGLLKQLGYRARQTPAPSAGRAKPTRTVALLLRQMGYVAARQVKPSKARLRQGIRDFQKANGKSADGKVTLQLLADMLRASRAGGSGQGRKPRILKDLRLF